VTISPKIPPAFYKIDLFELSSNGTIKTNSKGEQVVKAFPTFFATMGDTWKEFYKEFSFTDGKIDIKFLFLNKNKQKLKEIIEKHFATFLAYTNFGTRQSKGFGSFYLDKSDKNYIDLSKALRYERSWYFDVKVNDHIRNKVHNYYPLYGTYFSLFSNIELLYKTLRSGINQVNAQGQTAFYFKSLLHKYMTESELFDTWDKSVIKSKFISNEEKNYESLLSRDFLGLSTIQEYKNTSIGSFTVRHPKKEKDNKTPNEIQRFKSPIIFKPVKQDKDTFRVFVTHQNINIYDKLLEQKILLLKEKNKKIEDELTITFSSNRFDLDDFLDKSFKVDTTSYIEKYQKTDDQNYLDHNLAKQIQNIYKSIKENG